jgi:hypothetical protein
MTMDSDILVLQMWVRFYRDQLIKLSTDYDQLKNDFDSMEKTMILKIIKKISKKIVENELGEIYLPNEQKYHSDFKVVFEYTKKCGDSILNDFPEFKCLMINLLT